MPEDGTDTENAFPKTGLKLRAETPDDVVIFSTVLQDAVTIPADMTFLAGERRFALMLNRYVWEEDAAIAESAAGTTSPDKPGRHRIRCGLHFDGVLSVQARDIPQKSRTLPLELLAIHSETAADGGGALYLLFAGGGALRLEVECIDGYLADIGEPWICKHRPHHQP